MRYLSYPDFGPENFFPVNHPYGHKILLHAQMMAQGLIGFKFCVVLWTSWYIRYHNVVLNQGKVDFNVVLDRRKVGFGLNAWNLSHHEYLLRMKEK